MEIKVFHRLPDDAAKIRIEVFVDEQGFTEEFDTDDLSAIHFVGYFEEMPIATCRAITHENNSYFIGRVAVRKQFRGQGYGALIIKAAEEHLSGLGGKEILIHSQIQASEFYKRLGYSLTGEYDEEEGCPHCMMKKLI